MYPLRQVVVDAEEKYAVVGGVMTPEQDGAGDGLVDRMVVDVENAFIPTNDDDDDNLSMMLPYQNRSTLA